MAAIKDLNFAGQLIVWTARKWVEPRTFWSHVTEEFVGAMGERDGVLLSGALRQTLMIIDECALRPVLVAPLGCHALWEDEAMLVDCHREAQAGSSKDIKQSLGQFLPAAAVRRILPPIKDTGDLLAQAGYMVGATPMPDNFVAAVAAQAGKASYIMPESATVH